MRSIFGSGNFGQSLDPGVYDLAGDDLSLLIQLLSVSRDTYLWSNGLSLAQQEKIQDLINKLNSPGSGGSGMNFQTVLEHSAGVYNHYIVPFSHGEADVNYAAYTVNALEDIVDPDDNPVSVPEGVKTLFGSMRMWVNSMSEDVFNVACNNITIMPGGATPIFSGLVSPVSEICGFAIMRTDDNNNLAAEVYCQVSGQTINLQYLLFYVEGWILE